MAAPLTDLDRRFLRRALELAEGGRGRVSPNPLVGAVLAREGQVIGEGLHAELGGLHAERAALEDCRRRGADPAGATMYVTLEPCAHHGRQPPCADALLEAGVGRVVIASDDPSGKAAGRGPALLREAGVEVAFADGEEERAARLLNQPFRKHARTGLPHVVLKLAMSLDGRTETAPGDSPWISGEASRALVHRWRAEHDAIAVGVGTALADDPLLTARPPGGDGREPRQPLRVVFDSAARLPLGSRLLGSLDASPVLVVAAPDADTGRVGGLRDAGAEVLTVGGETPAERVGSALAELGGRGVTSLFLEGGRTLAAAFLEAGQVDQCRTFVAPVLLRPSATGPRAAGAPAGPAGATGPARLSALERTVETVDEDVLISALLKEW